MFQEWRNNFSWFVALSTALFGLYPVYLLANKHPFVALFVAWMASFIIYLKRQI